jgi:hypothetical protein
MCQLIKSHSQCSGRSKIVPGNLRMTVITIKVEVKRQCFRRPRRKRLSPN